MKNAEEDWARKSSAQKKRGIAEKKQLDGVSSCKLNWLSALFSHTVKSKSNQIHMEKVTTHTLNCSSHRCPQKYCQFYCCFCCYWDCLFCVSHKWDTVQMHLIAARNIQNATKTKIGAWIFFKIFPSAYLLRYIEHRILWMAVTFKQYIVRGTRECIWTHSPFCGLIALLCVYASEYSVEPSLFGWLVAFFNSIFKLSSIFVCVYCTCI